MATQQVIIVSGLSGAGKSTALNALEDLGYYCIDNLPAGLLDEFPTQIHEHAELYARVALGIDARAGGTGLGRIPDWIARLRADGIACQLLFIEADRATLIQRFSETRRRHPLTRDTHGLAEAIDEEMAILAPIRAQADRVLDSTDSNIHQLRRQVWQYVGPTSQGMTVVIESFAFKRGVPKDADFLFDARSLPNPHWDEDLRELTGQDPRVRRWLEEEPDVPAMAADILAFLQRWLPAFEDAQRSYVTIGIGCTGGKHRSVYLAERLGAALQADFSDVLVQHRELRP